MESKFYISHTSEVEVSIDLQAGGTRLNLVLVPKEDSEAEVPPEDVEALKAAVDDFNASGAGFQLELRDAA